MQNGWKRILSLFLALVMTLGVVMMPEKASAAKYEDAVIQFVWNEVNKDKGGFNPQDLGKSISFNYVITFQGEDSKGKTVQNLRKLGHYEGKVGEVQEVTFPAAENTDNQGKVYKNCRFKSIEMVLDEENTKYTFLTPGEFGKGGKVRIIQNMETKATAAYQKDAIILESDKSKVYDVNYRFDRYTSSNKLDPYFTFKDSSRSIPFKEGPIRIWDEREKYERNDYKKEGNTTFYEYLIKGNFENFSAWSDTQRYHYQLVAKFNPAWNYRKEFLKRYYLNVTGNDLDGWTVEWCSNIKEGVKEQRTELPFNTIYENDPTLMEGETKVKQAGKKGQKIEQTHYYYLDNQGQEEVLPEKPNPEKTEQTIPAQDEIILKGTRKTVKEETGRFPLEVVYREASGEEKVLRQETLEGKPAALLQALQSEYAKKVGDQGQFTVDQKVEYDEQGNYSISYKVVIFDAVMEQIPYRTIVQKTAQLPEGERKVVQAGVKGLRNPFTKELLQEPVAEIVMVGTSSETDKPIDKPDQPNKPTDQPSVKPEASLQVKEVKRVGGEDRIATAIALSQKNYQKADRVLIARADSFPDALCASVLSKVYNAPILLTGNKALDARVSAELARLGAKEVTFIGGEQALSGAVLTNAKEKVAQVNRLAGANRYETSALIAREVLAKTGQTKAFVTTGEHFADALVASAAAGKMGQPILLVQPQQMPTAIAQVISDLHIDQVTLIGGTNAVSKKLEAKLPKLSARIGGANRYETAALLAQRFFPAAKQAFLASGDRFADALVAGPIAATMDAPVLLTGAKALPAATRDQIKAAAYEKVTIVGLESAVSKAVEAALK